jgi:hypothetical protein
LPHQPGADLSKIEAGKLELNPQTAAASLINDVISTAGQLPSRTRTAPSLTPRTRRFTGLRCGCVADTSTPPAMRLQVHQSGQSRLRHAVSNGSNSSSSRLDTGIGMTQSSSVV